MNKKEFFCEMTTCRNYDQAKVSNCLNFDNMNQSCPHKKLWNELNEQRKIITVDLSGKTIAEQEIIVSEYRNKYSDGI